MTFLRIVIPLYLFFEHDLRANASRLSRGKTGIHFSGSCSSAQPLRKTKIWPATPRCQKRGVRIRRSYHGPRSRAMRLGCSKLLDALVGCLGPPFARLV